MPTIIPQNVTLYDLGRDAYLFNHMIAVLNRHLRGYNIVIYHDDKNDTWLLLDHKEQFGSFNELWARVMEILTNAHKNEGVVTIGTNETIDIPCHKSPNGKHIIGGDFACIHCGYRVKKIPLFNSDDGILLQHYNEALAPYGFFIYHSEASKLWIMESKIGHQIIYKKNDMREMIQAIEEWLATGRQIP